MTTLHTTSRGPVERPAASPDGAPTPVPRGQRPGGGRLRRWATDWLPALPALVVCGGLLLGSGLWLVRVSLRGVDGGWSLQAWRDILQGGVNRDSIVNSTQLSLWVSSLCVVLGTPLAWFLANLGRRAQDTSRALLNVVTNFGGASLAIAMISTLGGVGFVRLGLADWFGVRLGFDLYGFWGLVVVYSYFILPLYVLLLMPALGAVRPEWWEAVQASGGGAWLFWRRVALPALAPFVVAGWVLTFAWSLGQFSVPFALLGEEPREQLLTIRLGNYLFSATGGSNRFERAAAFAVLLMGLSGVALAVYRLATRRSLARLEVRA